MAKKICIFTVQGTYKFPLDMLWYDTCYPHQQKDVIAIEHSYDPSLHKLFEVTLVSQLLHKPTEGRWASFGWRVTDVTMI